MPQIYWNPILFAELLLYYYCCYYYYYMEIEQFKCLEYNNG